MEREARLTLGRRDHVPILLPQDPKAGPALRLPLVIVDIGLATEEQCERMHDEREFGAVKFAAGKDIASDNT